jgi:hypothetical protein
MAKKEYAELKPKRYQEDVFALYLHHDPHNFIRALTGQEIEDIDPEVMDACHEIHAGLDIIAIQNRWPEYQLLEPHDLPEEEIENDTHCIKAQMIANMMIKDCMPLMRDFSDNDNIVTRGKIVSKMLNTRSLAYMALVEGARILQKHKLIPQANTIGYFAEKHAHRTALEDFSFDKAFMYAISTEPEDHANRKGTISLAIGPPLPSLKSG